MNEFMEIIERHENDNSTLVRQDLEDGEKIQYIEETTKTEYNEYDDNNDNNDDNNDDNDNTITTSRIRDILRTSKYYCEYCNYKCNRKFLWLQHLETKKHNDMLSDEDGKYKCNCGKGYSHRQGLHIHKKSCEIAIEQDEMQNALILSSTIKETIEEIQSNQMKETGEERIISSHVLETLMNQYKRLEGKIDEIANQPKIVNQTINQKNKVSFNINQFLKVDCKNAMNLTDFMKSLTYTTEDLMYLRKNGYVNAFKNKVVREMTYMDETKRPIHCLDMKREKYAYRENDEWHRNNYEEKIDDVIHIFTKDNEKLNALWIQSLDPTWRDNEDLNDTEVVIIHEIYKPFNRYYKNEIYKDIQRAFRQMTINKEEAVERMILRQKQERRRKEKLSQQTKKQQQQQREKKNVSTEEEDDSSNDSCSSCGTEYTYIDDDNEGDFYIGE